jgi:hypothetical protein
MYPSFRTDSKYGGGGGGWSEEKVIVWHIRHRNGMHVTTFSID